MTVHSATPAAVAAVRSLLGYPATTIFVWGLVTDPTAFEQVVAGHGLSNIPLPTFGPGGALELRVTARHLKQAQHDLYSDLVRIRSCGRLGIALVTDVLGLTEIDLICSGWTMDTTVRANQALETRLFPGPVSVLERFGQEPFTLARSAHDVLAHTRLWP